MAENKVNSKKNAKTLPTKGEVSKEYLDNILNIIEANHASAGLDNAKAVASHTSTQELMSGINSSFNGNSSRFHKIIKECTDVYYTTPVVRNIIDLMADFACEGLVITHRVPAYQRLFNNWALKVGFYNTIRNIIHSLILTANTFIVRQEGKITAGEREDLTKASLGRPEVPRNTIPVGYTLLDPQRVEIDSSSLFGDRLVYYNVTETDVTRLTNPQSPEDVKFIKSLPQSFVQQIVQNKKALIEPSKLITLFYKKLEWQNWAYPLTFSALDDINFKKTLRKMDEASAADVIKAVIIFKLGMTEKGFAPDRERFQKLSSLLKGVAAGKNIVWDDLISIENSFPPIEKILGKEKYEVVDIDILSNYGVSQILVNGGSGGNFSTGVLSVRSLQEKLESVREDVLNNFVIPELERICVALNIPNMPAVRFSSMSLKDESAEKKLLIDLMDRKVISAETVLETFELDSDVESIRLGRKVQKFPDQISPLENTGEGPKDGGDGRPMLTDTPQMVDRNREPQGITLGKKFKKILNKLVKVIADTQDKSVLSKEDWSNATAAALIVLGGIGNKPLNTENIQTELKSARNMEYFSKYNHLPYEEVVEALEE